MNPGQFPSSGTSTTTFGQLVSPFSGLPVQSIRDTLVFTNGKPSPDNTAGPSTQRRQSDATDTLKKKRALISRQDTNDDGIGSVKEKKKKASRACIHCQKAHLTCDDARPCQRCVKRGIGDTCIEGHRKKAKYLLDDDQLPSRRRPKEPEPPDGVLFDKSASIPPPIVTNGASAGPEAAVVPKTTSPLPDPFLNLQADPAYNFESNAANLEYTVLSAMLGNRSQFEDSNARLLSPPPLTTMASFITPQISAWRSAPSSSSMPHSGLGFINGLRSVPNSMPLPPVGSNALYQQVNNQQMNGVTTSNNNTGSPVGQLHSAMNSLLGPLTPPTSEDYSVSPSIPMVPPAVSSSQNQASDGISGVQSSRGSVPNVTMAQRVARVYKTVTEPYNYVNGYHYLMQYLHGRFDKLDILRIVRALSIYRPSLIALQVSLTIEDEIFAEQALQRSLLELEKLISYSGTPTAVWRRTGEICLVGVEFVMLTGWNHAEIMGQKFIYELFEHQSVVEYWEKFAAHAFESASQTVYSHCVLLKPSGEPVPCAFCFSIRRDVFDLPNLVIGQWLPLL